MKICDINSESKFTACQNSLSEHSFEVVPASLYNLTKSVLDPCRLNTLNVSSSHITIDKSSQSNAAYSPEETNVSLLL